MKIMLLHTIRVAYSSCAAGRSPKNDVMRKAVLVPLAGVADRCFLALSSIIKVSINNSNNNNKVVDFYLLCVSVNYTSLVKPCLFKPFSSRNHAFLSSSYLSR